MVASPAGRRPFKELGFQSPKWLRVKAAIRKEDGCFRRKCNPGEYELLSVRATSLQGKKPSSVSTYSIGAAEEERLETPHAPQEKENMALNLFQTPEELVGPEIVCSPILPNLPGISTARLEFRKRRQEAKAKRAQKKLSRKQAWSESNGKRLDRLFNSSSLSDDEDELLKKKEELLRVTKGLLSIGYRLSKIEAPPVMMTQAWGYLMALIKKFEKKHDIPEQSSKRCLDSSETSISQADGFRYELTTLSSRITTILESSEPPLTLDNLAQLTQRLRNTFEAVTEWESIVPAEALETLKALDGTVTQDGLRRWKRRASVRLQRRATVASPSRISSTIDRIPSLHLAFAANLIDPQLNQEEL